jgi:hypothetical protein
MNSVEVKRALKYFGSGENKNIVLCGVDMKVKPGSMYELLNQIEN